MPLFFHEDLFSFLDACPGPFGVQRNDFIFFIDMVVTTDLDQIRDDFLLNTLQFPLVFLLIGRRASAIIQNDIKGQTALDHLYHSFIVFPTFKSALRANHKQDDMAVVHIFIRFHLMLDRRVNARSIHEDIFSCIIRLGFGRSGALTKAIPVIGWGITAISILDGIFNAGKRREEREYERAEREAELANQQAQARYQQEKLRRQNANSETTRIMDEIRQQQREFFAQKVQSVVDKKIQEIEAQIRQQEAMDKTIRDFLEELDNWKETLRNIQTALT